LGVRHRHGAWRKPTFRTGISTWSCPIRRVESSTSATRIVTDKLSGIWHQAIVVETEPGASGNLAWDQVSRAEPDGYTWTFLGPATMANQHMYAKLRWSAKSFVPVGATVWGPSALVVHPSLPVNTEVAELYAADAEKYAKVIREVGLQALGVGARSKERQ
jgi:tripartite-type tricarboxylate transporter receptor subunit TctC